MIRSTIDVTGLLISTFKNDKYGTSNGQKESIIYFLKFALLHFLKSALVLVELMRIYIGCTPTRCHDINIAITRFWSISRDSVPEPQ